MDTVAAARASVVAAARSFIGTPYHHHGQLKGVGTDCATTIVLVYREAGFTVADPGQYPQQFFLHRNRELFLEEVEKYAHRVEVPQLGDLVVFKIGRVYAHGAIVVDPGWPTIVHADAGAGQVIEDRGDGGRLAAAPRLFYSPW
jgi:cell wall-associated NlpC family hydrolase